MRKRSTLLVGSMLALAAIQARPKGAAPTLTALDYAEIHRLYAAYAHAWDSCAENGQVYARLFTSDGAFISGARSIEGRQKLAEFGRCPAGLTRRPTQHWVGSIFISPSPEGAGGTAYSMQVNTAEPKLSTSGNRYEDVLVKGPQGWAFKRRTLIPTPRPAASAP